MSPEHDEVFSLAEVLDGPFSRPFRFTAERLLGLPELERLRHAAQQGSDSDACTFLSRALDLMHVDLEVSAQDLGRIPATGPTVVVANHPFGAIEGMALARALLGVRPDVRVLVNFILGRIPELRDLFFLVDPFETAASPRRSLAALRQAIRWVGDGGMLMIFPSGEVSHLDLRRRRVRDPRWLPTAARIIRRTKCQVVPIYFLGRNSMLFQLAGLIHPMLRTGLLPRELLKSQGTILRAKVGKAIPYKRLATCANDQHMVRYLRERTEILAERDREAARSARPSRIEIPSHPLIEAIPDATIEAEIAALPEECLLVDGGDQAVYVASAAQIPQSLREIGRLRELTFREVGEGTGAQLDLDEFDQTYDHLFIWHREQRELVGAYRIGKSDRLIERKGLDGLYTSTLFRYSPKLHESMGPALELGRSFIRPEYQRSFAGLMLLWKGIGRYVLQNPCYSTLFGPVSISAEYASASQQLIVTFLKQNNYAHPWARWVRPRNPFQPRRCKVSHLDAGHLDDLEEVSAFIAEIEADEKGVPILLRQYLKLGGRLLGFNVDPDFSNVLDVLIMVDLRQTEPRVLARYMGRTDAERFLAMHHEPLDEDQNQAS